MTLRPVSAAEIESLAIGAWILGTGGGGSPYLALLNMRKLYRRGVVVSLLDPMDLADDARVAVVSNMGAPLVGQERLTDPRTIALAVQMMEEYRGYRFDAVMSLEIGGGNPLPPFMAAAVPGLPVVDAHCLRRAVPGRQVPGLARHQLRARLPERVRRRLARRPAPRDDPRSHLRPGQRVGRRDRHRDFALRPARQRDRVAGAAGAPDPEGARARRAARLRLRPRVQERLRV